MDDNVEQPIIEVVASVVELSEDKIKEIQNKAFGHILNQIDVKLAEAGFVKPQGVKTTDYILDVIKAKPTEEVKTVIDTDSGAKIKALQDSLRAKEIEIEQVKASTSVVKRDFYLDSTLSSLSIEAPSHLSEVEKVRYIERAKKTIKNEISSNYDLKEVDGQFKVYDKEGSPVLDGTIDMDSIKLDSLLKRDFSEFFVKAPVANKPVTGTGGDKPTSITTDGVSIPASVKNAGDLHQFLVREKGATLGDATYMKYINVAKEQRPVWFK